MRPVLEPILTVIIVLAIIGAGLYHLKPPAPLPTTASLSQFSAVRAMSHVRQMAVLPHPTGTPGNERVRHYLTAQLTVLGLDPHVQTATAEVAREGKSWTVNNVIAKLNGSKPGKALALVAHYDSVPTGPGAADNAASVAAILETIRALMAQGPLQNDVICLFTDGEEIGLWGAKAFVGHHPWFKDIGVVLNFEYRGNRGAFMMFETTDGNGKLIKALADAVPFVLTNSLMGEVYKRLPNDTDFSVFKQTGVSGMNFAVIDGLDAYHTGQDTPENLSLASLQHQGEIMVALTRYFGNRPLMDLIADDVIYFDLPGWGVVHYPLSWVKPSCWMAGLTLAMSMFGYRRKKLIRIKQTAAGLLLFPGLGLFLAAINQGICWLLTKKIGVISMNTLIQESDGVLMAVVAVNLALYFTARHNLLKWLNPVELSSAILANWLLLAISASYYLPGASFLLIWPLSAMLVAIVLNATMTTDVKVEALLVIVGLVPCLLLWPGFIRSLFVAITPGLTGIVVLFLIFVVGLTNPLINIRTCR